MALLLGVSICAGSLDVASAATSSSPVQEIIANGFASVNAIRSFFFCETAACKKDKSKAATAAGKAISYLEGEAVALQPSTAPSAQRPIMKKFIDDVKSLSKVYAVYASETTANDIARNTGIVYYESANVGSDIYLLTSAVHASKVLFGDWDVGAVAVLYAMQIDSQVESAKTSSALTDVAANLDLEQDAVALTKDANGPNAQFNELLISFAKEQTTVSKAQNDVLERKKTSLTTAELKSDISTLGAEFSKIVNLQKTLAKSK
jgi:hypothetical protein